MTGEWKVSPGLDLISNDRGANINRVPLYDNPLPATFLFEPCNL